jgi:hypothetical protein
MSAQVWVASIILILCILLLIYVVFRKPTTTEIPTTGSAAVSATSGIDPEGIRSQDTMFTKTAETVLRNAGNVEKYKHLLPALDRSDKALRTTAVPSLETSKDMPTFAKDITKYVRTLNEECVLPWKDVPCSEYKAAQEEFVKAGILSQGSLMGMCMMTQDPELFSEIEKLLVNSIGMIQRLRNCTCSGVDAIMQP